MRELQMGKYVYISVLDHTEELKLPGDRVTAPSAPKFRVIHTTLHDQLRNVHSYKPLLLWRKSQAAHMCGVLARLKRVEGEDGRGSEIPSHFQPSPCDDLTENPT